MGPHYFKLAEWLLSKPLTFAHAMNFLSLADTLELAHNSL